MNPTRWGTLPPDLLARLARYASWKPRCVQRTDYRRKRVEEAERRRAAIPPLRPESGALPIQTPPEPPGGVS